MQNTIHPAHGLPKTKNSAQQNRERVERMLRDIAFVLKMTQKVRESMEEEKEVETVALA